MAYKVVILPAAQRRLEDYIRYTKKVLKNSTAAKSIARDARTTKKRLSELASTFALCENEALAALGYRIIRFEKHSFFMVYRIEKDTVFVDAMFHDLQDYEGLLLR